ncbi:MAG: radical SAM protein [Chloroflexi bacterium]|nr:radical SAM protein [Chloroflexota bacterium]
MAESLSQLPRPGLARQRGREEVGPLPHLPAAYSFAAKATRGAMAGDLPRVVFVEVTNRCNLSCATCPRTFVAYEAPATLSRDNFLRIVRQFPDMQRAVLHGIGEPLLNPDLPRMIADLKRRGITVLFNTNATLLTDQWARALVASGLDEIRCSLDAAEPATFEKIRGRPLLPIAIRNLQRLTETQRELEATNPRISIWMTGLRENIGQLPDLVRLAARVGVREVHLQRMVYYLDHPESPGLLGSGHALLEDHAARAESSIAEAEDMARELGVTLTASGASAPRQMLESTRQREPRPWAACLRPWSTAYVTANGNCLPCCMGPFATRDYAALRMGNLFEQDFSAIWNNEKYRAWRHALLSDHPPRACQGCGTHWSL